MKLRTLGLLSLGLAVCISSALMAQDQTPGQGQGRGRGGPGGGPGGPGGRGGFGGFGGPGISPGGALELAGLLRDEKVQKEVEMTADTYSAIRDAMPDMRELFSASEGERTAKLKEANEKAKEMLDEVLSPEHQKRLMGLLVQQNGNRAAANDLIAKEIGLDDAGMKKVQEAATKATEEMTAKMREMFSGGGGAGGFDREKMTEMRDNAQKDTDKAIAAVLSAEQLAALEALKGEKFEFSPRTFGGPGGGGPGGRGGAGGGRPGARPGSDN